MKPTTIVSSRVDAFGWRGVACTVAIIALSASAGCGKKSYPTISSRNPDAGHVHVHGTYNHCPFAIFTATPDHTSIDRPILLDAIVSDQNNDPLAFFWQASSGTIERPTSPTTMFRCAAPSAVTLTLTVSDPYCDSKTTAVILCQPTDAGAPDGGSTDAGGGDTGGQAGTGGTTGGSGGAGGSIGPGGTTGAAGTGGSIGPGGTTGGGRGGATGGGGASGGGGSGACSETNPPAAIAAACLECLDANDNPVTDGCCQIRDPVGLQVCQAASACMRTGGPPVGVCNVVGDVTSCFCGTNLMTCDVVGQPNGPCVSQIAAAAARNVVTMTTDSPSPGQVLARYGDPAYALGRASNIAGIAGNFCSLECGF